MKKLLVSLMCLSLISTPAMADSIQAEVKFSDLSPANSNNEEEYQIKYSGELPRNFGYTAEVSATHAFNTTKADFVGGLVYKLPEYKGFNSSAYVELGQSFRANSYTFWSSGVKVSKNVYGPVSIAVGYRHREGFNTINKKEDRLNGGLKINLTKDISTQIQYYRTTGSSRKDQIGLSLEKKL